MEGLRVKVWEIVAKKIRGNFPRKLLAERYSITPKTRRGQPQMDTDKH